ncbi:CDP-glycerol glycerophosphotransferase family protein [Galbitalea sp. SE-J8]|uniref:CDP-glycerol glycerophosphotransferase family protein n=1 Tax=Galbitalea sp. SE-J8 TaxID=3054952 RepID=UPI00259CF994|nr:CDP-glycerol glycerophosphotransferase family protein [Galbitalea sp. SE-J8]MDM4763543.1 CDP-glycerol glycerophosphotransferase family protein [Galbitalea sp. SE-J8]
MPILTDIRMGIGVISNAIASWRARRRVQEFVDAHPWPSADETEIVVHFADAPVNLYQIRQWYAPLVELSRTHPVVIMARSPLAMMTLAQESPLPVVYVRKIVDLENFVASREPKVALYVNQNVRNFSMLRFGRLWHVFINHGESDKAYMVSNQFKAYDFALIAGQAARERLSRTLWGYDVAARTFEIGRPQADHFAGELPYAPDDRTVVLYAPTWEGDRESMRYGSVSSHGETLVKALLQTGRHRVIYRPHPRSGIADSEYGAASKRIVAALAAANADDPTAQHVFDDRPELGWQLAAADLAITDISALVYDRLATGKPLIVTRPLSDAAEIDEGGYLSAAEWLTAAEATDVVAIADRVLTSDEAHAALEHWVSWYFGDTTAGAATARFRAAMDALMVRWAAADAADAARNG